MTDKELKIWSLQKRFDETCLTFRHVTQLYMTWFTVFSTTNIVTLAWVGSRQLGPTPMERWVTWVVASAFILKDVLAIITSCKMVGFSRRTASKLVASLEAMSQQTEPPVYSPEGNPAQWFAGADAPIPLGLTRWGFRANAAGLGALTLIWLALAIVR